MGQFATSERGTIYSTDIHRFAAMVCLLSCIVTVTRRLKCNWKEESKLVRLRVSVKC